MRNENEIAQFCAFLAMNPRKVFSKVSRPPCEPKKLVSNDEDAFNLRLEIENTSIM